SWTNVASRPCSVPTNTGGILVFKCHNLGADETADPLVPSWKLNGAYFQWGKKQVDTNGDGYRTKPNSGTEGFAAAPTGPGAGQTNEAAVASWSTSPAAVGAWNLTEGSPVKTANDPCPSGYRVPTRNEWESIYSTTPVNTQVNWSNVGTYTSSSTNYIAGKNVNNSLYLPASGYRDSSDGALGVRGSFAFYWSSTVIGSNNAYNLEFNSGSVNPADNSYRINGFSVRCVAE
uniref:FISUMP domain-containing protein n=1 Tax=Flavobacterium sp. TaxID=239 RepID=UPI0033412BCE